MKTSILLIPNKHEDVSVQMLDLGTGASIYYFFMSKENHITVSK